MRDQEIKEIAKVLNESCGVYDENGNFLHNKCNLDECEYWSEDNYLCCSYNKKEATELYNAGYRKLVKGKILANKVYSDKTLKTWTKEQLIEHIRVLEYNWKSALDTIDNQVDSFGNLIVGHGKKVAEEILKEVYAFLNDKNDTFDIFELAKEYGAEVE